MFIVNGCLAGNIFDYDANRFTTKNTLSEKFVLEPEKGAITYLSSSNYGIVDYLDVFTNEFYKSIATTQYGEGLGNIMEEGLANGLQITGVTDFYGKMHAEQLTLHGDPSLRMSSFKFPDYIIDSSLIKVIPNYISTAGATYTLCIPVYNLGRATNDTVHFSLFRKSANGDSTVVYSQQLFMLKNLDTIRITLPIIPDRDMGIIHYTAYIDDNHKIHEICETNNWAHINVQIFNDIKPISPYNYSIINTDAVDLYASTSDLLSASKNYVMEMDTTALFNSPAKISMQANASGGVVQFLNVALPLNNTVYYWRVAEDTPGVHWNVFFFHS